MVSKNSDGTYDLDSGFLVEVTGLPPYHLDFVEEALPLPEFPSIHYVNPAGDAFELEYTPPDECPDVVDDEEGYYLYMQWHSVSAKRIEITQERIKTRRDFVLSNCVHVLDGPYDIEDDDWVMELEGALVGYGYKVPEHRGARRLAFIKSKVIVSDSDWFVVRDASIYAEITVDGVYSAMDGLGLKWDGDPIYEAVRGLGDSPLEHNVRAWEAETAEACGIPFDEKWYNISVSAREVMVASRIGKRWSSGLLEAKAAADVKRKSRNK